MSYTIGYQMAPEYCSHCWSIGPWAVSAAMSWSRQSFWSSSRLSPSSTISAESPPGPSVIDVSTWISTVRPSVISMGVACSVRTNCEKPRLRRRRSSSRVG